MTISQQSSIPTMKRQRRKSVSIVVIILAAAEDKTAKHVRRGSAGRYVAEPFYADLSAECPAPSIALGAW